MPESRARSRKPETKYHWTSGEHAGGGLQRIVREQLQLAIWELATSGASLDDAIHEARKSLKKVRSAMRLMRGALGQEYAKENAVLRDSGRELSQVRDAQALIEVFDELNTGYREKLGGETLSPVRDGLVSRKEKLDRTFHQRRVKQSVLRRLREVAARVEKWDLAKGEFQLISDGFARTIRRNRKAFQTAHSDSDPQAFHEWRKRAKDLRYHLGLLHKTWPPVLSGYEDAAKELEQKLGDDHNLVVLRDTILENPGAFGDEKQIGAFLKIVEDHQKQLRSDATSLATRLYSEKPKDWRRRLHLCWAAWKQEHS